MSPVFGHGRLRLYLLKLLEESPRHGYEVIRLLQDRFLGVYSPSPGTIYPRLARLEEEGLVTHELIDGKKVFSITDKGRQELNGRLDELADLEQEIADSVRDIAREVKEDVRETVKTLREELTLMARTVRTGTQEDGNFLRRQQHELKRIREQQKRQWMDHFYQWQSQGERLGDEWRRIWTAMWSSTGGDPSELDAQLGEALADFVAQIRTEAAAAPLTPEALAQSRQALDEAAHRIRQALQP